MHRPAGIHHPLVSQILVNVTAAIFAIPALRHTAIASLSITSLPFLLPEQSPNDCLLLLSLQFFALLPALSRCSRHQQENLIAITSFLAGVPSPACSLMTRASVCPMLLYNLFSLLFPFSYIHRCCPRKRERMSFVCVYAERGMF